MRRRFVLIALVGLVSLVACRQPSEPVARLAVSPSELEFPHGRYAQLQLRWELLRSLPAGTGTPVVFMHMRDAQGNVLRTFDHSFPAPWRVGQQVVDRVEIYHSLLGSAVPAGTYDLTIGLYDGKSKRFRLRVGGAEPDRQEYVVGRVHVPEVAVSAPAFAFSSHWLPVEPSSDRQLVARRWLSGDGDIDVRGLPSPAGVWMVLRIPKVEPPLRLVMDPGITQPTAQLATDCSGFTATVLGEGFHELNVPVPQGSCRIHIDSNYYVLEMGTGRKLSVALEQLGWQPGGAAVPPAAQ